MTQDTLQVTEAAPAAQGIQSFELRHPQGLPLQPFSAGSHLRVKTPSGMLAFLTRWLNKRQNSPRGDSPAERKPRIVRPDDPEAAISIS